MQPEIKSICERLHKSVLKFDYSHTTEHFSYQIWFRGKSSFNDFFVNESFLSIFKKCTVNLEWGDEGKFGYHHSFYVNGNNQIETISELKIAPSTILPELNLAEMVKKSEQLFELAAHLDPKMYSGVSERVYNNIKHGINNGGVNSLHELITLVADDMKDEVKNYEL